jgi:hypothetical protein
MRERRTIDTIATVAMPFVAFLAALLTAYLAGCTGPAYGASAEARPFVASAIRFVPDEGASPGAVRLQLAGLDLEQNRFALRVVGDGPEPAYAAGRLRFDDGVVRLDQVTPGGAPGTGKLHFTALTPGTTRIDWAPERSPDADLEVAPRRAGGTLVVE